MGFKFNNNKKQNTTKPQKKANIRPTNRRCAQAIMEQYSERIDQENCRRDLKALLKKCLFKIVAAESVDQEICFLNEVKSLLQQECLRSSNDLQYASLKQLVKEMYQIAVDKQIDQYYHQSSKYIDHLNVHDESFRIYTLRNFHTLTSNTNGDNHLTFSNILQHNQPSLSTELYNQDLQEETDNDEEETIIDQQTSLIQQSQGVHSTTNSEQASNASNQLSQQSQIQQQNSISQQPNIQPNQQHTSHQQPNDHIQSIRSNRQLIRSTNSTNLNQFTNSTINSNNDRQNNQTASFNLEPFRVRYQTNETQSQNRDTQIVRVNAIDQSIISGDNDYRISYIRSRNPNTNTTTNTNINTNNNMNTNRPEDHKDQLNETSQQNYSQRRYFQQSQI